MIKLYELKPIDFKYRKFWISTWQTMGAQGAITLASPLLNTIIHWKHRNTYLDIDESAFSFRNGDEYSQPRAIKGGRDE